MQSSSRKRSGSKRRSSAGIRVKQILGVSEIAVAPLRIGSFQLGRIGEDPKSSSDLADRDVSGILADILKRYDLLLIMEARTSPETNIDRLIKSLHRVDRESPFDFEESEAMCKIHGVKEHYCFFYRVTRMSVADVHYYGKDPFKHGGTAKTRKSALEHHDSPQRSASELIRRNVPACGVPTETRATLSENNVMAVHDRHLAYNTELTPCQECTDAGFVGLYVVDNEAVLSDPAECAAVEESAVAQNTTDEEPSTSQRLLDQYSDTSCKSPESSGEVKSEDSGSNVNLPEQQTRHLQRSLSSDLSLDNPKTDNNEEKEDSVYEIYLKKSISSINLLEQISLQKAHHSMDGLLEEHSDNSDDFSYSQALLPTTITKLESSLDPNDRPAQPITSHAQSQTAPLVIDQFRMGQDISCSSDDKQRSCQTPSNRDQSEVILATLYGPIPLNSLPRFVNPVMFSFANVPQTGKGSAAFSLQSEQGVHTSYSPFSEGAHERQGYTHTGYRSPRPVCEKNEDSLSLGYDMTSSSENIDTDNNAQIAGLETKIRYNNFKPWMRDMNQQNNPAPKDKSSVDDDDDEDDDDDDDDEDDDDDDDEDDKDDVKMAPKGHSGTDPSHSKEDDMEASGTTITSGDGREKSRGSQISDESNKKKDPGDSTELGKLKFKTGKKKDDSCDESSQSQNDDGRMSVRFSKRASMKYTPNRFQNLSIVETKQPRTRKLCCLLCPGTSSNIFEEEFEVKIKDDPHSGTHDTDNMEPQQNKTANSTGGQDQKACTKSNFSFQHLTGNIRVKGASVAFRNENMYRRNVKVGHFNCSHLNCDKYPNRGSRHSNYTRITQSDTDVNTLTDIDTRETSDTKVNAFTDNKNLHGGKVLSNAEGIKMLCHCGQNMSHPSLQRSLSDQSFDVALKLFNKNHVNDKKEMVTKSGCLAAEVHEHSRDNQSEVAGGIPCLGAGTVITTSETGVRTPVGELTQIISNTDGLNGEKMNDMVCIDAESKLKHLDVEKEAESTDFIQKVATENGAGPDLRCRFTGDQNTHVHSLNANAVDSSSKPRKLHSAFLHSESSRETNSCSGPQFSTTKLCEQSREQMTTEGLLTGCLKTGLLTDQNPSSGSKEIDILAKDKSTHCRDKDSTQQADESETCEKTVRYSVGHCKYPEKLKSRDQTGTKTTDKKQWDGCTEGKVRIIREIEVDLRGETSSDSIHEYGHSKTLDPKANRGFNKTADQKRDYVYRKTRSSKTDDVYITTGNRRPDDARSNTRSPETGDAYSKRVELKPYGSHGKTPSHNTVQYHQDETLLTGTKDYQVHLHGGAASEEHTLTVSQTDQKKDEQGGNPGDPERTLNMNSNADNRQSDQMRIRNAGGTVDMVPLEQVFCREPFAVLFLTPVAAVPSFAVVAIHTDPSDARKEAAAIQRLYDSTSSKWNIEDIIIAGDFHTVVSARGLPNWRGLEIASDRRFTWAYCSNLNFTPIENGHPPIHASQRNYDRLIVAGLALNSAFVSYGTGFYRYDRVHNLTARMIGEVSDHYPIEIQIAGLCKTRWDKHVRMSAGVMIEQVQHTVSPSAFTALKDQARKYSEAQPTRSTAYFALEILADARTRKRKEIRATRSGVKDVVQALRHFQAIFPDIIKDPTISVAGSYVASFWMTTTPVYGFRFQSVGPPTYDIKVTVTFEDPQVCTVSIQRHLCEGVRTRSRSSRSLTFQL